MPHYTTMRSSRAYSPPHTSASVYRTLDRLLLQTRRLTTASRGTGVSVTVTACSSPCSPLHLTSFHPLLSPHPPPPPLVKMTRHDVDMACPHGRTRSWGLPSCSPQRPVSVPRAPPARCLLQFPCLPGNERHRSQPCRSTGAEELPRVERGRGGERRSGWEWD